LSNIVKIDGEGLLLAFTTFLTLIIPVFTVLFR